MNTCKPDTNQKLTLMIDKHIACPEGIYTSQFVSENEIKGRW